MSRAILAIYGIPSRMFKMFSGFFGKAMGAFAPPANVSTMGAFTPPANVSTNDALVPPANVNAMGAFVPPANVSTNKDTAFAQVVARLVGMMAGLYELNVKTGTVLKVAADPRVIPGVGQFIRKHSMAWVIIGTPGDGESTKPLSHSVKASLDLQLCERRPGLTSCVRNHYTSPEFLSFGVFGGSVGSIFGATAKAVSA